jgi:hypothetical protein
LGVLAGPGLLLAFFFGNARARNASTKLALVNEAAALSTVLALADYFPEPGRSELKRAIWEYTRSKVLNEDDALRIH